MKSISLKIQDSSHYEIIDLIKGICAIFVIMLHAIPGETPLHKLLLMPFHAQLTIPFFMIISGFNWIGSVEKTQKWYSCSNLFRKVKRVVLPYLPALIIEIIFLGWPGNIFTWLASGGYQMPGSYYVILMIQLIVFFPFIRKFYDWNNKHTKSWFIGLAIVFFFQCAYEWLTYIIDLPDTIYRLLIFRYTIFLYAGICIRKMLSSNIINWKILIGMIPLGVAFIVVTGYLNWQPQFLFRYPVWYHSSAPTILWALPIIMYILWNGKQIHLLLNKYKIFKSLYNVLRLCGKSSYHIYIFQMLWFGMIIYKFNINSAIDQLKVFCVSVCVCCAGGIIYYCLGKKIRSKRNRL